MTLTVSFRVMRDTTDVTVREKREMMFESKQ